MFPETSPASIADAQVLSFLDEVVRGTRRYEQVYRLEGQVEREYRGRVLYELLQNAHDALPRSGLSGARRVRVVLGDDGGELALLAANDGLPLVGENVRGLCEMALSTKDPSTSIGNKGVGFRSVLGVSEAPQVYSRDPAGPLDGPFQGHCFAFDPEAASRLSTAVIEFLAGGAPQSPFSTSPLVPPAEADRLRDALHVASQKMPGSAAAAALNVSPYALPLPAPSPSPAVSRLAAAGFATVVRLPLRPDADLADLRQQLNALAEPETLLFLDRLDRLELSVDGVEHVRTRTDGGSAPAGGRTLVITATDGATDSSAATGEHIARFWSWTHTVGEAPEEHERLAAAIAASGLPDSWQRVTTARVDVAVEAEPCPRPGRYSLFLPTRLGSGSAAFLNAPFSGSLNRDRIDPTLPLNHLLLGALVGECARVVWNLGDADPADAVTAAVRLALVAPVGTQLLPALDAARLVRSVLEDDGLPVADLPVVATDQGWAPPRTARVVDGAPGRTLLTPAVLQQASLLPAVARHLVGSFRCLADALGTPAVPTPAEHVQIVETAVAAVAAEVPDVDWDVLLADLRALVPTATDLSHARVLPSGTDGGLVTPAGPPTLFFPPELDKDLRDVPPALQSQVAFLSPRVHLRDDRLLGRPRTEARKYLASVVSEFEAEDLLRDIVTPAVPTAPLPLDGDDARRWASILPWAARLLTGDAPNALSRSFPVPCLGGWFPAGEAAYGPGWDDLGPTLGRYLRAAHKAGSATAAAALDRTLLPPDHAAWGVGLSRTLLDRLGVAPGLRLAPCIWPGQVKINEREAQLPTTAPVGFSTAQWQSVLPRLDRLIYQVSRFKDLKPYQFSTVWTVPGIDGFEGFGPKTLDRLSRLAAAALQHWPDATDEQFRASPTRSSWRRVAARKVGGDSHMMIVESPLSILLRSLPWLSDGTRAAAPDRWWLLPERWLADRDRRRYDYLQPVPRRLAAAPGLADALAHLGAGRLAEEPTSPDAARFIDAVAAGLAAGAPERDIVAHARDGWEHLASDAPWPQRLVVRDGTGRLSVVDPAAEGPPVFLPDGDESTASILRQHGHALVLVDPKVARRLATSAPIMADAGDAQGHRLLRTSDLAASVLVDGSPWQAAHAVTRPSEPTGWLAEIALAAHAFGGNGGGVLTDSFARAAGLLLRVRLVLVDHLETALTAANLPLSPPAAVPAHWHAASSTLLVARGAPLPALVEPLLALLDRRDIDVALSLVLESLATGGATFAGPPADETVATALAKLHVDADRLSDVRRHLRGDFGISLERARAVASLLGPHLLGPVSDATSARELRAALRPFESEALPHAALWELCRSVPDDDALGRALYDRLGPMADLGPWNDALTRIGAPPVRNAAADGLARAHLREAAPLSRALLRQACLSEGRAGSYLDLAPRLSVAPPDALDGQYWETPFAVAVAPLVSALRQLSADPAATDILASAASPGDARGTLTSLGIDLADPDRLIDENARQAQFAAVQLARIAETTGAAFPPHDLEQSLLAAAADALRQSGIMGLWSDIEGVRHVASAARHALPPTLVAAAASADSFSSFLAAVGVSQSQLDDAHKRASDQNEQQLRRRRLVSVCGAPFDAAEGGGGDLWKHLLAAVPTDRLPTIDLSCVTALAPVRPRRNRDAPPAPPPSTARPPTGPPGGPQWKKDLVGVAGEMFVFRALQARYGEDTVPPAAWVSRAREHVYPDEGNDGLGYDIAFDHEGIRFCVEVKASAGTPGTFEMGSSEVAAAKAAAQDRSARTRYLIARVSDALTEPSVALLPNPFSKATEGLYRIEPRGAYVTFRTA